MPWRDCSQETVEPEGGNLYFSCRSERDMSTLLEPHINHRFADGILPLPSSRWPQDAHDGHHQRTSNEDERGQEQVFRRLS